MNAKDVRKKARQFCGCPEAGISCSTSCKDSCCVMRERYDGYIAGYEACHTRLRKFANRVYSIIGVKAISGCGNKSWDGFCNGNGTDVGCNIDKLIVASKKLSQRE